MRAGDVIAERFELVSIAGQGGMGVVWRAHDRATGEPVALKALLQRGSELEARFAREARVLAALGHSGVVRHVADGTTAEGDPWLAMEWLDGEDLASRLRRGPLASEDVIAVGLGIAQALAHAHSEGLVHRDLKPSNVWLVEGDVRRIKVLDFGVVRRLAARETLARTRAGAMVGTPGYMAPEQARGERDVDARADVYALGCVLFECVTGQPAFVGEHVMALLAKVLLEEPPRPSSFVALPVELDALVARMLSKEPSMRPASAGEVATALAEVGPFDGAVVPTVAQAELSLAREQRWRCVLAVRTSETQADDTTVMADTDDEGAVLARLAASSGARLVALAGGAQVLLWETSGAPLELAARAARAALAIAASIRQTPMALASGRAAVGGGVPVGEALERAAACLARSMGAIALDQSMATLLDGAFEVERTAGLATLVSERAPELGARTLLGKATPCVGRDVELSTLLATIGEVVEDDAAAAVVMTGETGVGKSRVRHEWLTRAKAAHADLSVWEAQGDAMHEGAALGIAAALARSGCGVRFGASRERVREAITAAVATRVEPQSRSRVASRLCELCAAPWEGDVDEGLRAARADAIVMGDQLRAAWEDFLVASCAAGPVVLVVEQLEWADASSLALVDRALRNFGDRPWMVLGVGRPEHRDKHPKLWSERGVREVVLGPLKDRPAERLVRAALGDHVRPERVARLVERAAGNPYFLEELVRAEAEGRGDETPETVLAIVESRLMRLDAPSRRVLRAASVYGARHQASGVAAILEEASVEVALEHLARQEWLAPFGAGAYAFRQQMTRDAAYATILDDDRRLAHGRAAEWLVSTSDADDTAIATHFEQADLPGRAAPWWIRAAQRALEANDLAACITHSVAAERAGASGDALCDALLARAEAHHWLGNVGDLLAAAERIAAETIEPERLAAAVCAESSGALRLGAVDRLIQAVVRMTDLVSAHPESDAVIAFALRVVGNALQGGASSSVRQLWSVLERAQPSLESRSLLVRGSYDYARGMFAHFEHDRERYLRFNLSAAALFESANDVRRAVARRVNAGYALVLLGAYEEAAESLSASIVHLRRLGLFDLVAVAQQNMALALCFRKRWAAAVLLVRASIDYSRDAANRLWELGSRIYLARILTVSQQADDAVTEADRALNSLDSEHALSPLARAALADALLARGAPGDTRAALAYARIAREALRANSPGFEEPALILRVHLDALEANGLHEEAARERAEARAWVLERAAKIESESYRRTFLYDEPDNARILGHR
jgi:hypothetical protein